MTKVSIYVLIAVSSPPNHVFAVEEPEDRQRIKALQDLVNQDESGKGDEFTKAQEDALKDQVLQYRAHRALGMRASNAAAAKDYVHTLSKIVQEVSQLDPRRVHSAYYSAM